MRAGNSVTLLFLLHSGIALAAPPVDLFIGIDEAQAQARGKAPADGGFAHAHHADQHDRAALGFALREFAVSLHGEGGYTASRR